MQEFKTEITAYFSENVCHIVKSPLAEDVFLHYCIHDWEGYFGNVIGYRLLVTIFKMSNQAVLMADVGLCKFKQENQSKP